MIHWMVGCFVGFLVVCCVKRGCLKRQQVPRGRPSLKAKREEHIYYNCLKDLESVNFSLIYGNMAGITSHVPRDVQASFFIRMMLDAAFESFQHGRMLFVEIDSYFATGGQYARPLSSRAKTQAHVLFTPLESRVLQEDSARVRWQVRGNNKKKVLAPPAT